MAVLVGACGSSDRKATLTTGEGEGNKPGKSEQAPKGSQGEPSKKVKKGDKPKYGEPKKPANPPKEPKGPNLGKPVETDGEELKKLKAKAASDGEVPVIIGLKVDAQAEGELDETGRGNQREKIKGKREDIRKELQGTKHSELAEFDAVPFTALKASPEALERLERSPNVNGISEDKEVKLLEGEEGGDIAGTSSNEYLADWWNFYRINLDDSWTYGYRGAGQTVAILDTGVKSSNPWISGRIVREACYAYPNGCPNGGASQFGTGSARPCTYSSGCAHGTHVAGTAAGANGVAPDAKIIAVQVFHPTSIGPQYYESDLLWGMNYVYNQRGSLAIAAVNLSVGNNQQLAACNNTSSSSSFYSWTQTLRSVGIAVVVATGNNNYSSGVNHPACNTNTTSVGNSNLNPSGYDAVYGYTKYGSNSHSIVDLLAPGTHICGPVVNTTFDCNWTGTSMAAPHVTGAMATLKQLEPWTSVSSMELALQASGVGVYDSRNGVTRSRIDVWKAIVYAYNH